MHRYPLAVCAVAAAVFLLSVRHFWPTFTTANESIRYFFISALVDDHTVAIDQAMARYHSHNVDRSERGGHAYSDKAPGASLLALPAYLVWKHVASTKEPIDRLLWFLTLFACTIPALVATILLARFARQPLLVPALLCATPLAMYATQYFGHAAAAAALIGAFLAVETRRFLLAGLLCAAAVACEYPVAPFAAGVAALGVYRGRIRALALLALGGLPIAIGLSVYHHAAFGSIFATGYRFKATSAYAQGHAEGFMGFSYPHLSWLWGVTFSRQRGLFFYAPWLLLAIPGCRALWDRDRPRVVFLAATCAGSLILVGSYHFWAGGDCVGPRFLVPVIPFFALLAFAAPPAWHAVGAGLGLASLVQTWIAFQTFPFHPIDVPDPLYTMSLPLLLAGYRAPPTIALLWLFAPVFVIAACRPRLRTALIGSAVALGYLTVMVATSPAAPPEALRARGMAISLMHQ